MRVRNEGVPPDQAGCLLHGLGVPEPPMNEFVIIEDTSVLPL